MKRDWRVLYIILLTFVGVFAGSAVAHLATNYSDINTISLAITLSTIAVLTIVISDLLRKPVELTKSYYARVATYGFVLSFGLQIVLRYILTT